MHTSDVTFHLDEDSRMEVHHRKNEPWKVTLVDTGDNSMTGGRLGRVKDYLAEGTFCFTYGDGVADKQDKCPNTAGDPENEGCPWADRDGDGVPDKEDQCPDEKGTAANGGCPAQPTDLIKFIESEDNRLLFAASSSDIDEADQEKLISLKDLLDRYANTTITVEGHASSDGSSAYNKKLSEERAEAVKDYLIKLGLEANRIETIGYGETKPVESNSTAKGRKENRRAEINRSAELKFN